MLEINNGNVRNVGLKLWYDAVFVHFKDGANVAILDAADNVLACENILLSIDKDTPGIYIAVHLKPIAAGRATKCFLTSNNMKVRLIAQVFSGKEDHHNPLTFCVADPVITDKLDELFLEVNVIC